MASILPLNPAAARSAGEAFPLNLLESRLRCPLCGSRRVTVLFEVPNQTGSSLSTTADIAAIERRRIASGDAMSAGQLRLPRFPLLGCSL